MLAPKGGQYLAKDVRHVCQRLGRSARRGFTITIRVAEPETWLQTRPPEKERSFSALTS